MSEPEPNGSRRSTGRLALSPNHRTALIVAALTILILFWNFIFSTTLHALFYLLEILELGLDDLLEALFQLELHTAQMYTAWMGLLTFMALGAYAYLRITKSLRTRSRSWSYFGFWLRAWLRERWAPITLLIAIFLAANLLF